MKRRFLTIMACLCALFCWVCRAESVRWLQTTHDFGAFDEDINYVHAKFQFVNDGSEPVAITQVASTCGCTVAKYDSGDIAPGDTASIEVTYNAVGRPGRFSKDVYVRTSDSHERQRLTIKGVVIGNNSSISNRYPVEMGPLKLHNGAVMMGRANPNSGKTAYIECYNQSNDSLRVEFDNVPKYLQASTMPQVIPPGELATIDVYFRGDRCSEWGIVTDSLKVITAPGQEFWLPSVVIVEEDFSSLSEEQLARAPKLHIDCENDRINLGTVPLGPGKIVKKKVQITNQGKDPLIVRRVYSQDPSVTINVSSNKIKGGKKAWIEITFDPSKQPAGVVNTRFSIITNDPTQPTRTVRVVADRK